MKPIFISKSVLVLAVLWQAPVSSQEVVKPEVRPQQSIPQMEVLTRFDRDKDGILEPMEVPKEARRFVDELIAAANAESSVEEETGNVELKVLEQLLRKHLQNNASDPQKKGSSVQASKAMSSEEVLQYAANLVSLYDTNKDRHLEAEEFRKLSEKWIECDLNQDLRLDVVEVACGIKYAWTSPKKRTVRLTKGSRMRNVTV